MFTGLIETLGKVENLSEERGTRLLQVRLDAVPNDWCFVKSGDSIAVNGVCLTILEDIKTLPCVISFGVSPETLRRSNLGDLTEEDYVNLERSMKGQNDRRYGGHFVQGHVDTTGSITSITPENDTIWYEIETDPMYMKYIVPKGYISVDGTSLTVCSVRATCFTLMLVPYTQERIVLAKKKVGDKVNLEVDIIGKYVEKLAQQKKVKVTEVASSQVVEQICALLN